jgi:hypothetical protein
MIPIIILFVVVLACFLISTCVVVMTFSAVETRRTVAKLATRLEFLAERSYSTMAANHREIIEFGGRMDETLGKYVATRLAKPDPEPSGETTIRKDRPS